MSDLISREDAREAIEDLMDIHFDSQVVLAKARDAIVSLPSAEPKTGWIPVSDELPEEGKIVLTQARFKDDIKMAVSSRIDYNYWTGWGTREVNIIAWMPLPEPYREDGES